MALPYLSLIVLSNYFGYLGLVVNTLLEGRLHSISTLMAIGSIFAYVVRVSKGSGALQDGLIILTLTVPVVLPSLLMVGLLLSPFQDQLPKYFSAAADLYLIGIASLAIVLPLLGVVNHASVIFMQKGSAAGAVLMTMVNYGLVAFVGLAGSGPISAGLSSKALQIIGARILVDSFFTLQSILSSVLGIPLATGTPKSAPWLASPDRIWTATLFAMASAVYFYYRLYHKRAEEEGARALTKEGGPIVASLHSIGFAIFLAVLVDAGLIFVLLFATQQLQVAVEFSMVLVMATIILLGFADRLMPWWFGR
jgi:hypothetical protein